MQSRKEGWCLANVVSIFRQLATLCYRGRDVITGGEHPLYVALLCPRLPTRAYHGCPSMDTCTCMAPRVLCGEVAFLSYVAGVLTAYRFLMD
ncbi:hypothetical protein P691DRAFT_28385 [Macrolepiota fuliginosa MF-IS2]|uniref:Uncharacterized protein n=1 Tax=Macrolepiota fuliginosa MF-IS2 TaxID=1400762 RepID=A0A9P6C1R5_9AGAR|nr:hypothetical protein P691DRAFT_28385 [Macrolepiota fuliginosa MF-IS2]